VEDPVVATVLVVVVRVKVLHITVESRSSVV